MAEGVKAMAELMEAAQVAREAQGKRGANGVLYASFGDNGLDEAELARMVQAVPTGIAAALKRKAYYFVPLAIAEGRRGETGAQMTMVAPAYSTALADEAICHRNVALGAGEGGEGVFISARLMNDRFALAFEFFINVGHAFVDEAGVAAAFAELVWNQAASDVRGETSMDSWESRAAAMGGAADGQTGSHDGKSRIDEKAKTEYLTAAFSDAVAIYLLSLTVDFDYSELREREYPLLAPQALAERLKMVAQLFPPNADYEFAIRYRRRG
ncbi:MAG TPA: hypothetical protein VII58_03535 [Acidobacteriaceae bacterium]